MTAAVSVELNFNDYQNVLSNITPVHFDELIDMLCSITVKDHTTVVKKLIGIMDDSDKKDEKVPEVLTKTVWDMASEGLMKPDSYMRIKSWYQDLEETGVSFRKPKGAKKKAEPKQNPPKEPDSDVAKAAAELAPETPNGTEDLSDEEKRAAKAMDAKTGADLDKAFALERSKETEPKKDSKPESKQEEPAQEDHPEEGPKPEPEAAESKKDETDKKPTEEDELFQKRSAAAKKAAETRRKKADAARKAALDAKAVAQPAKGKAKVEPATLPDGDILSTDMYNSEIYATSPSTHPDLFIEYEGQFLSKRLLTSGWKPTKALVNPFHERYTLCEVLNHVMFNHVSYEDLVKVVEGSEAPRVQYTARRIWWMLQYNEFLRFGFVKDVRVEKIPHVINDEEIDVIPREKIRLVQAWLDHPMFVFLQEQWDAANKK